MASTQLNFVSNNDNFFVEQARRLYGADCDLANVRARFADLAEKHRATFGEQHCLFFSSPGRIELVGNHTDHQHGKVLCASINLDTLAAVSARDDNKIVIKSGEYPLIEVDVRHVDKVDAEQGTSLALVKGVVAYFASNNLTVGGFCCSMTSNVARGSGVSSSASFECCVAEILSVLYNNANVDAVTKAKASQWAESYYFGKPCGLLDQCAIALGGISFIDFANPEKPVVQKLNYPFDDEILLINSGGDHTKLTDCYTAIRQEMRQVAAAMGREVLNDVPYTPRLFAKCRKAGVSGRAVLRALHFYQEQDRVDAAVHAVVDGVAQDFYDALNASGYSSACFLQNTYVPGDTAQPINVAVEMARAFGAACCRVHGGGFAGTVLALYQQPDADEAYRALAAYYGEENIFRVHIRPDGAVYTGLKL